MLRFRHLLLAFGFHAAIGLLMVFGVQCSPKIQPPPVMVAVMVSGEQQAPNQGRPDVAPTPEPDNEEEQRLAAQQARERERERAAEQQRQVERRRLQEERQRQQADQRRREQEQAEQARAAEARAAAQAEALRKAEAEAQRQAQAEAQRQAEAQAAAEAQAERKAEEERRRKEEEARRQAEEEQKRKAEEERRKAEAERKRREEEQRRAEQALRDAVAAETAAQIEAEYISGVQRTWQDDLRDHIRQRWIRPPGLPDDVRTTVAIELLPNGQIINVRVVKGSGISAFDDSVVRAVQKSDPLPLPSDPKAFVRELRVTFSPADLE